MGMANTVLFNLPLSVVGWLQALSLLKALLFNEKFFKVSGDKRRRQHILTLIERLSRFCGGR